jgi:hypothetical protein
MQAENYHRIIEKRSIALHELVREKLLSKPELVEDVKAYVVKLSQVHPSSKFYFDKWLELLEGSRDFLLKKLTEDSEEMCAMRQSSPFAGILNPRERWEVYETFRA